MKRCFVIILAVLLAACAPSPFQPTASPEPAATASPVQPTTVAATPTAAPPSGAVTVEQLENFTYVLEANGLLQVTLVNGSFRMEDPNHFVRAAGDLVLSALGDLNGDGVGDGVVSLAVNYGGSGTFHQLIAVLSENGRAVQAATLFLEDRIAEKKLTVSNGLITLDAVRHTPQDPLCCPTEHAVTVYRYNAGQLEKVSDQVLPSSASARPEYYPNQITLASPQTGDAVGDRVLLRGTTSQVPFEKNLVVRVYDGANRPVLAQALTVQGEYGGPGSFEANLQLPPGLKGTARLDVVDIDAANGQPRGLASVALNIR